MTVQTKKDLVNLDKKHYLHPTSSVKDQQEHGPSFIFTEGNGVYLTDTDGKQYIDGISSLWNVNVGHGRTELGEVAKEQMSTLAFSSSFSNFSHEPAILLAEKIAHMAPEGLNAVFFTSGGSESNDSAFKLAKHYWRLQGKTEKKKIVSLEKSYHGVSGGATHATGLVLFREMAGPMSADFFHAQSHYEASTKQSIDSLRELIEREGAETIAAFIVEPIQGAGGVLIPDADYFKEVRQVCDEYNILFIADEVITGFGRTGKMFGLEHYGVIPDMMTFAKGVTSGYIPLGGVVISDKIHDVYKTLSTGPMLHGFTYSGHPTACAVALRNIQIIEDEQLVNNSREMGKVLLKGFERIKAEIDIVGDVRAIGLLGALELFEDPATNKRFARKLQVAGKVNAALTKRGVICRPIMHDDTDIIAFAPPLIINQEQINVLIENLHAALLEVRNSLKN